MKRCVENIDLSRRPKGATHFFWDVEEEYPDYAGVTCWEKWETSGSIYEMEAGSWGYLTNITQLRDDQLEDRIELPPEEPEEPVYWDGESTLKVGMIVTRHEDMDLEYTVEMVRGVQVVLYSPHTDLMIVTTGEVYPIQKSKYEEYKKKVLDKWQKQGLDYAYDELTDEQEKIVEICFEIEQEEG